MAESANNVGVRPSTTTGSLNIVVDPVTENGVPTHYPKYKQAFGPDGTPPTTVDNENPLPVSVVQEDITHKTDVVTVLNHISMQLEVLIKYQAMLHKVDLTEDLEWP